MPGISEEYYSRAGSALVTLRQEHGVSEMRILRLMIQIYTPGAKLTFPEAAAIAAVTARTTR